MKKFFLSILAIVLGLSVWAGPARIPARMDPVEKTQPNGEKVTIQLMGDEHYHWLQTTDGYHVKENAKGIICYVDRRSDKLKKQAHDAADRTCCEKRWLRRYSQKSKE